MVGAMRILSRLLPAAMLFLSAVVSLHAQESPSYVLDSALVRSDASVRRYVGNHAPCRGMFAVAADGAHGAGTGIAVPFRAKKATWVEEVGFAILEGPDMLSHMNFRVNFYRKSGPDRYVPAEIPAIDFEYAKADIRDGRFTFVFPEAVRLPPGEYCLELEFLADFPGESFVMKSGALSARTLYRAAGGADWKTIPFGNTLAFRISVERGRGADRKK